MVLTVAILSGGKSGERGASLKTGKAASKAFASFSYNIVEIDTNHDIVKQLKIVKPDLAFIALHSPRCENGSIQGLLEILGIKYTHSGVLASAVAGNKVMSKQILQSIGIDAPRGYIISREDILKNNVEIDYPYVLKPIDEGSSIGVHIIFSHSEYLKLKNDSCDIREKMLIEEYVPGVDLLAAVFMDEALGTMEIRPKNRFFDHEAKKSGLVEKVFPAEIPDDIRKKTLELALRAHRFLNCKSVSRSDFRYNPADSTLKMLEINTHPTLHESSSFQTIVTQSKGIHCNDVFDLIVKDSL